MRALLTSSRMFFAIDEIRKLGDAGHLVFAADTFRTAPGSHSKEVTEALIVPPPADEPLAFVGAVADLSREHHIDWLLPQFEEVFYLARHRDEIPAGTEAFFPTFDVLARLHDKARFVDLMQQIGLPVARSMVARSPDELRAAVAELPRYFARAAYSRGGVELVTNAGPLAGAVPVESVTPTDTNPWVVQEFIEGTDVCSFSVVHHGQVTGHAAYHHPLTIEHAGGITFESIDAPATLDAARAIAEATGYHGQVSFDYLCDEAGTYWMVECNVRPTAGVLSLTGDEFVRALLDAPADPVVAPAGRRHHIDVGLVRDMVVNWKDIPGDVKEMWEQGPGVYHADHDPRPLLYVFLSLSHLHQYRHHLGTGAHDGKDIMRAQFYDIAWDGQPIP